MKKLIVNHDTYIGIRTGLWFVLGAVILGVFIGLFVTDPAAKIVLFIFLFLGTSITSPLAALAATESVCERTYPTDKHLLKKCSYTLIEGDIYIRRLGIFWIPIEAEYHTRWNKTFQRLCDELEYESLQEYAEVKHQKQLEYYERIREKEERIRNTSSDYSLKI